MLYGLIHARYILTSRGMNAVAEKYQHGHFGRCPRVLCQQQPVLPVGRSDLPRNYTVNVYCPMCQVSRFFGICLIFFILIVHLDHTHFLLFECGHADTTNRIFSIPSRHVLQVLMALISVLRCHIFSCWIGRILYHRHRVYRMCRGYMVFG